MHALIIDDDPALCRSLQIHLERAGHSAQCVHTAQEGMEQLSAAAPDVAFIDLKLPDRSGLDVLAALQEMDGGCLPVMITGTQDTRATIEAVRLGAFDYIRKPLDLDMVMVTLEKALQERARKTRPAVSASSEEQYGPHEIVGADAKIVDVIKQIGVLSQSRVPVLIEGESGTGKELVARALHEAGSPGRPFVALNCSAVAPTLLESEIFGHVRGAFTGAERDKTGRLEQAGDGTIFFDEIGDMSPALQAKLLRALQEKTFERVGDVSPVTFRARVVAATHRDLSVMAAEGDFREDLYYRLAVSVVHLPPLRERPGDIPLLTERLLTRIAGDLDKEISGIDAAGLRRLEVQDWPGNVRQLENVLTRAALLTRAPLINEEVIAAALDEGSPGRPNEPPEVQPLREAEKNHIAAALQATGWNITRTAALLDISPTTLRKKIGDYGLAHPRS